MLEETRRTRGLVSSRESGARVEARRLPVPRALQAVVETFWVGRWDLRGQEPHTTELLGDPSLHLVFERSDAPSAGARVVGVWTQLWRRELRGVGFVRGVKLHPGATRAVMPEPASQYRNRIAPLDAPELERAVLDPAGDEDGVAALAAWLENRVVVSEAVLQAVALVRHARAVQLTRVDALAAHAGISVRSLQRLFREHVGASPKWVVRRFRLQEVAARAEAGETEHLGDLAYTLGYADQAHLARDFRAATGRTLTALLGARRR
jgi:AraC-like DNA-binding protein